MARKRTLGFVISMLAVGLLGVPAVAQLKAEPITPNQQDHRASFDFIIGHERLGGVDRYATALAVS